MSQLLSTKQNFELFSCMLLKFGKVNKLRNDSKLLKHPVNYLNRISRVRNV